MTETAPAAALPSDPEAAAEPSMIRFAGSQQRGTVSLAGLEDPPDGLLWAFASLSDGSIRQLGWDDLDEAVAEPGGFLWIHVNPAGALARGWLERTTLLHAESVATLLSADDRPRFNLVGNDLTVVIQDLQVGAERQPWEGTTVRAILDRRVLVTTRKRPSRGMRKLYAEIRSGAVFASSVLLFTRLVDEIATGLNEEAMALGAEIDRIEEHVLSGDVERIRRPAVLVRRGAYRLSRLVQLKRNTIALVAARPPSWFAPEEREAFAAALDRLGHVGDDLQVIQDRARAALDEIGSRVAEQTNRNTLILSVVTVIFAPLTLITSIFGMNTGGLPFTHDPLGTLWMVAMLVLVTGLVLWLLRRNRMI